LRLIANLAEYSLHFSFPSIQKYAPIWGDPSSDQMQGWSVIAILEDE
jgi:hypothetical protein